jgi:hypothetical protein
VATHVFRQFEKDFMSSGGNPFGAFLGFWMFLQLVSALTTLAGGLYALFCLHRMAQNMARLADSMEDWTQRQNTLPNSLSDYSSGNPAAQPFVPPVPPVPPSTATPPSAVVPPAAAILPNLPSEVAHRPEPPQSSTQLEPPFTGRPNE